MAFIRGFTPKVVLPRAIYRDNPLVDKPSKFNHARILDPANLLLGIQPPKNHDFSFKKIRFCACKKNEKHKNNKHGAHCSGGTTCLKLVAEITKNS